MGAVRASTDGAVQLLPQPGVVRANTGHGLADRPRHAGPRAFRGGARVPSTQGRAPRRRLRRESCRASIGSRVPGGVTRAVDGADT